MSLVSNRRLKRRQKMKPLELVYWVRFVTGIVAAIVCIVYVMAINGSPTPKSIPDTGVVFNSISLAIIIYILTYYLLKPRLKDKVVKTQKLFTTGIGIYFLAWIVFYALLYTWLFVG
jgi:hypothetical protein